MMIERGTPTLPKVATLRVSHGGHGAIEAALRAGRRPKVTLEGMVTRSGDCLPALYFGIVVDRASVDGGLLERHPRMTGLVVRGSREDAAAIRDGLRRDHRRDAIVVGTVLGRVDEEDGGRVAVYEVAVDTIGLGPARPDLPASGRD